ncbi:MAG: hypothetical protein COY66_01975 [Candidatus Kerfeldbacteria bacterium CG_4_10_14_0_8_um_filter_42_10]|uniref:DUF5671 domain-containing protein n=1 Tax=Candidatus Kerfeldbacteria bacterium CG_4_10_14_0_8_um_filter_42_10 TaxID=2014248 RepID=A0A2M7RK58_9BACT|nr:MAG: hypothetical protein COY66_01975 [Candidatus Kerfeldbacteria bacterium CG_4_10_14_0_8_um_filter_42_10]
MNLLSMVFMPMSSILALGIIIFFVLAIVQEGKKKEEGKSVLREAFFYIVAFLMIGFVVGSGVILVQLGLKSFVLTEAKTQVFVSPPVLMLNMETAKEPVVESNTLYSCGDQCEFSELDQQNVALWKNDYNRWKNTEQDSSQTRQQQAAAALSFLIVALPLYVLFYRKLQKDHKAASLEGTKHSLIRSVYFYALSLAGLLLIVIPLAFIINIGLTTWVFPKADLASEDAASKPYSVVAEKNGVQSIINCAGKCNFTEEEVSLAQTWLEDYNQAGQPVSNKAAKQNRLATGIAFLLFGAPLFAYHFKEVKKERKNKKEEQTTNL